ncbi:MAG: SCO family protein, partial [Pseudomonadota bacterium]|nr:SCO family protein [Pseudomonadota bacterium]
TGNPDNMKKLAAQLNAFYVRVDREDGGYLMDHSANIVLLDSELNYRGYIEPPHDPKRMLPVIRSLLALP